MTTNDRAAYLAQPNLAPERGTIPLPNGSTLYWRTDPSVGCRIYESDEVGAGVGVWNTALVDDSTLLAALTQERALLKAESEREKDNKA